MLVSETNIGAITVTTTAPINANIRLNVSDKIHYISNTTVIINSLLSRV